MTEEELKHWDARAREKFTYREDQGVDTWRSHAAEVLAGTPWSGDCDDLTATVNDLLSRAGCPLDQLYRLLVSTTRTETVDHTVACAVDDHGGFWVLGDTFRPAYPAAGMPHRGITYNRLSEAAPKVIWRDGTPWKRG